MLITGCAYEKYQAKPIEPEQVTSKILNKDPASVDFKAYLVKQGQSTQLEGLESGLPFTTWGLNELTLCALYFHPKLDVAKAQLALADTSLQTANQKQTPTLNGNIARSNLANGDKRPWAYGLNVEIPIETGNKREIRIEEAQHLVEAARMDVAETAWQLRSQIAKDLLRYHENVAQQQQLTGELKKQDDLVKILEKRMQMGALSSTELNAAKLIQQKTLYAFNSEQGKSSEIRAILASDVGLSQEKFNRIVLKPLDLDKTLSQQSTFLDATNDLKKKRLARKGITQPLRYSS